MIRNNSLCLAVDTPTLRGMIDRIEFATLSDGVAITFYYDTDCMDTFSMFEPDHINSVMKLVATEPEPEHVLIAIRDFGRFSLH